MELTPDGKTTGESNTGNWNTGDRNTGNGNTGDGNCGNLHSGSLNHGPAPFFLFNKSADRALTDLYLVGQLAELLQGDDDIAPDEFLSLPNSSAEAIKELHDAHKAARATKRHQP